MMGTKQPVPKHTIPLMKGDIAFIGSAEGTNWEHYKNVQLIFNEVVLGEPGLYAFETPHDGEIHVMHPVIDCIIPKQYREHLWDESEEMPWSPEDDEPLPDDEPKASAKEPVKSIYDGARAAVTKLENLHFETKHIVVVAVDDANNVGVHPIDTDIQTLVYAMEAAKGKYL